MPSITQIWAHIVRNARLSDDVAHRLALSSEPGALADAVTLAVAERQGDAYHDTDYDAYGVAACEHLVTHLLLMAHHLRHIDEVRADMRAEFARTLARTVLARDSDAPRLACQETLSDDDDDDDDNTNSNVAHAMRDASSQEMPLDDASSQPLTPYWTAHTRTSATSIIWPH